MRALFIIDLPIGPLKSSVDDDLRGFDFHAILVDTLETNLADISKVSDSCLNLLKSIWSNGFSWWFLMKPPAYAQICHVCVCEDDLFYYFCRFIHCRACESFLAVQIWGHDPNDDVVPMLIQSNSCFESILILSSSLSSSHCFVT